MFQIHYQLDSINYFMVDLVRKEVENMDENMKSQAFCDGVAVGIRLIQNKVVTAQKEGKPIMVDGELYYVFSGRDRLKILIDNIYK